MKLYAFLFISAVCILISSCGKEKTEAPLLEERHTVSRTDLRDVISQTGVVQPVVNVELKSEASGKIERIAVKEGQKVSKGDTILVIDPSRLQTQRQKLQLSLRRARIDKDVAERNYANGVELVKAGTISARDLQDLENQKELASISYQQQLLELRDVADQLEETVITSPMSGVITSLLVKEGEIAVSATSGFQSGTAIGTIADITKLEVITSIGEVDYVHLSQGQNVVIRPEAMENTRTSGTVQFISLSAKRDGADELGSFEVRASVDSLIKGIAPGINVNVEFVILDKKNVLAVPYHFVRKQGKRQSVQVVRADKEGNETIETVPVKTGDTDYRNYEILSGLKEGDIVYFRHKEQTGMGRGRR
ncbi:MAG: efflux RND transporter periplasmic adaptor subunit [Chitinispirillaceae bacterium]